MVECLISGKIDLTAVRTFPKEEFTVLDFILEFRIFRNINASVDCYFLLLTAFGAGCEGFVDD
jgi:hypothetical protein